ncbi:MAG: class 1 fructose-bisphosphatase [Thermoplasmata archaeon]
MSEKIEEIISNILDIGIEIRHKIPYYTTPTNKKNIFGDDQKALDVISNEIFIEKFKNSKIVGKLASEEMEDIKDVGLGEYYLSFDPLDGSSNIETNNLIGTIVAIFKGDYKITSLVASMYILYGPSTTAVIANNNEVNEYILDESTKEWKLKTKNMRFPAKGWVYGIGGLKTSWPLWLSRFEASVLSKYKLRYGGALVGDFNQVMHYGGFFAYPELVDKPNGKYRAYFESIPLALISKYAGGTGTDGNIDLLNKEYKSVNDVVPTYLGNIELINEMVKYKNQYK